MKDKNRIHAPIFALDNILKCIRTDSCKHNEIGKICCKKYIILSSLFNVAECRKYTYQLIKMNNNLKLTGYLMTCALAVAADTAGPSCAAWWSDF